MSDKKRPIEERIAALMGRTAYRDIREGFGGTGRPELTDQDLAAALGIVSKERGRLACLVLETHYASTLRHAEALLRAWDEREHRPGRPAADVVLTRFAGELAIREFASMRYGTPQLAHFAYLVFSRRERLQERMKDAQRWLVGEMDEALIGLRKVLRDPTWEQAA